jgi:hypothetical protein
MAPAAMGTFPPVPAGGDDARALYEELTDDLLYDPAIGRATMMATRACDSPGGSWRPTTTRRAASS